MANVDNKQTRVIAITGGKGGVGKTNVATNLGVAFAKKGLSTMLLDADLGLANVDILLGLRAEKNLSHVLSGECDLEDVIIKGPCDLQVIPASSGVQTMVTLTEQEHGGIIQAFSQIEQNLDVLLVDTAAGISDGVASFNRAAQEVIVVVCDEPTSITDSYALIKVLSRDYGINRFRVLANMVRSNQEGKDLFLKLSRVTDKFLDVTLQYIGTIPYDEDVRKAVKSQKVVVDVKPNSKAAQAFTKLADRVLEWKMPTQASGHMEFFVEKLIHG